MPRMPQLVSGDQDDNAADEVIVGVDTHSDVHVAAVITALGVLLGTAHFPTTSAGYQALVGWVGTLGRLRRAGVEGTGSYGAALTRHLRAAGVEVIEVNAPDKPARRRRGKTDTLDAEAAARAVLSGRASGSAKTGDGPVEMLRMLKMAKDSAVKARSQTINQLKAVLVAADPALREALSGLTNTMLIRRCAQLEATTPADVTSAAVYTLRLLARRIRELTAEICDLIHHITTTITRHCPTLLTRPGVGPDNAAAVLITAGDNPDRLHNEASFAAYAASTPWKPPRAKPAVAALTAAATAKPIARSTASPSAGCAATRAPATTSPAASPKAKPAAKPSAASSDT